MLRTRAPLPRPRLRARLAGLACAPAALALGCLAMQADEVRTGVVGMPANTVRACLGDVEYVERLGESTELWAFVRPYEGQAADIEISIATGPGTAFKRPTVEAGNPEEVQGILDTGVPDRIGVGTCQYVFQLEQGRVRTSRIRGRSLTNMNADDECAMAIRHCVPEAATP